MFVIEAALTIVCTPGIAGVYPPTAGGAYMDEIKK